MQDPHTTFTAVMHVVHAVARGALGVGASDGADLTRCDRGSVSIEQVLWYAAAAVSVAIVATIIWNSIRDQANTPASPGGL